MTTRKKKRSSPYDELTQHLIERLENAGVEVGSTRELLQIGLAVLVDLAETNPGEYGVGYLNSFRILSNASKTEHHVCKGELVWVVIDRDNDTEPTVEIVTSTNLPSPDIPVTIKRGASSMVESKNNIEVEEW